MNRTVRIALIVAVLGLLAWVVIGFFRKSKLDLAVSKLDSAMMVLEHTQMRVDNSQLAIENLQQQLAGYQDYVGQVTYEVQKMSIQSQRRQEIFARSILNFDKEYKERQEQLQGTLRTYWPLIRIDTTRNR